MTPTQKPRIKRDYSITKLRFMWFCTGQGSLGIADTPNGAYNSWLRSMRVLGRMPYPNFWS
jgi:hypothetical protein